MDGIAEGGRRKEVEGGGGEHGRIVEGVKSGDGRRKREGEMSEKVRVTVQGAEDENAG